jgi:hypothetical protein
VIFLFPCNPISPGRPDEPFVDDALAAQEAGLTVALVDHDGLSRPGGQAQAVRRVPAGRAVYRGWMLSSSRYEAFARALGERGATLHTDPAAYQRGHELPGWYPFLVGHTPDSAWTAGASLDQLVSCCASMGGGAAILRDFVKSAKHDWDEACFVPDVRDAAAVERVARRLLELRGDDFAGGFVLRRFEAFRGAEVRTWWVDGELRLATAHPDSAGELPPADLDVSPFVAGVRAIGSPFLAVDLVRNAEGQWRVVEVGDGQVSARPKSTPAGTFLQKICEGWV